MIVFVIRIPGHRVFLRADEVEEVAEAARTAQRHALQEGDLRRGQPMHICLSYVLKYFVFLISDVQSLIILFVVFNFLCSCFNYVLFLRSLYLF